MSFSNTVGKEAEDRAATMLMSAGLQLLERNYRCRLGEIDLIMRDRESLVFVEVRYRRSSTFGGAVGSVDTRKQHRITQAARHYLLRSAWDGPCRFDVVGIDSSSPQPTWIRNAFIL